MVYQNVSKISIIPNVMSRLKIQEARHLACLCIVHEDSNPNVQHCPHCKETSPILLQHTPPPPPAPSLHPAQSSKPCRSKSLPNHSPEASEQLHGPHICLDVDLQAPYARMGGLRRPGFQARQNQGTVLLYPSN